MARRYARVKIDIWRNAEFRRLSTHAQHLYFTLLTNPEMSYCGITDWRPARLSGMAGAWMRDSIDLAALELLESRMVIICEDTEEALIRSFVRHDGVLQNAKLAKSAANAVSNVSSVDLMGIVTHEIARAKKEYPKWVAWGFDEITEVLKGERIDAHEIDPFAPGLAPAIGRLRPEIEGGEDA